MDRDTHDFAKYLKINSSRHHYIPQFLINGFVNSNGLLYIYDKQKDKILHKQRPPKSIFYENDRNTLELDENTKTSIIEDLLYKEIDDRSSKVVKLYQTSELSKVDFNIEDNSTFLFFLISLFWRIPKTDYAANNLIDRSEITTESGDPEILRNDPTFRKINRAGLFKHHISEMKNFGEKGTKWLNIHQNENPVYVIGDYPILFKKQPSLFSAFNDTDILVAVSSTRIYSSTIEPLNNFSERNSFRYNACIIDQSVNYVACGDIKILEYSILLYKKLKETGLIYGLSKDTFKTQ